MQPRRCNVSTARLSGKLHRECDNRHISPIAAISTYPAVQVGRRVGDAGAAAAGPHRLTVCGRRVSWSRAERPGNDGPMVAACSAITGSMPKITYGKCRLPWTVVSAASWVNACAGKFACGGIACVPCRTGWTQGHAEASRHYLRAAQLAADVPPLLDLAGDRLACHRNRGADTARTVKRARYGPPPRAAGGRVPHDRRHDRRQARGMATSGSRQGRPRRW